MRQFGRCAAGLAVIGLAAMAVAPAHAQHEGSLLGLRLRTSYRSVLARYGQPTRIVSAIDQVVNPANVLGANVPSANPAGAASPYGSSGLPGMSGAPGAPGGNLSSAGGMARAAKAAAQAEADQANQIMNEMDGRPSGSSSGYPPGYQSGYPGGSSSGSMGQTAAPAELVEQQVKWIYDRGTNLMMFLFDRNGQLLQIQSFGYTNGGVTSRGVKLGDGLDVIMKRYGFTSEVINQGNDMLQDYSKQAGVAFQLRKQNGKFKVIGIMVAVQSAG